MIRFYVYRELGKSWRVHIHHQGFHGACERIKIKIFDHPDDLPLFAIRYFPLTKFFPIAFSGVLQPNARTADSLIINAFKKSVPVFLEKSRPAITCIFMVAIKL